jgi:glycosyltransferase involved in cell wall biosynthesis
VKILYVITKSERGGAQVHVRDLALGMSRQGHEVTVATGGTGWLTEQLRAAGEEIAVLSHLSRSWNPWSAFLYVRELQNFLKNNPFDLVHFHSSNSLLGFGRSEA